MSEPSAEERLTALRFLRRVQVDDLARTDRWIARAEQQVADAQKPPPKPEPTRAPLPRPPWATEMRHGRPPILHGRDCWLRDDRPGTLTITADDARHGLTNATIEACDICRPDTELGMH